MVSDNREGFTRHFVFLGNFRTLPFSVSGLLLLVMKWRYAADGEASSNVLGR